MVLRGSKTQPDSLLGAYQGIRAAEIELQKVEEELVEKLKAQRGVGKDGPTLPELSEVSQANITDAIARLQKRQETIETLEKMVLGQSHMLQAQDRWMKTLKQFAAGGFAGMCSRTAVAPIDRVKILMQTEKITSGGSSAKYTGVLQSIRTIVQEGGVTQLWRSNTANLVRVAPYSASQFASYDLYKVWINQVTNERWGVMERLSCGALAAITATTVTHPLDVIRVRIATQSELRGMGHAVQSMLAEGANPLRTFYKGYVPTVLSLTPFIAINFATFDWMKSTYISSMNPPDKKVGVLPTLLMGAGSGLFAQTICYPLDTVRRRMQLKGTTYSSTTDAVRTIMRTEGPAAFYLGMIPNALKIVPNNAIRFFVYSQLKDYLHLN